MGVNCFNKFRQRLKMELQISFINFIMICLVMMIIGFVFLVQGYLIFSIIENSSFDILRHQEYAAQLTASESAYSYLNYKNFQSIIQLKRLQELFTYISNNNGKYLPMNNLTACLISSEFYKSKILSTLPLFYYIAVGSQDKITLSQQDQLLSNFNQSVQYISQFSVILDFDYEKLYSITDFSKDQFFASYPPVTLSYKYNQSERLWYINHIAQQQLFPNQDYFFSPVFQMYGITNYEISLTMSLKNNMNKNIGIIGKTVPIYDNYVQNIPFNIILVNELGEILFYGVEYFDEINEKLYIYNESITGFNYTDWELIQSSSLGQNYNSSCLQEQNMFCLYNKRMKIQVLVNSTYFKQEQFILIGFTNVTYDTSLDNEFDNITIGLNNEIIKTFSNITFGSIVLIGLSALISHIIFRELEQFLETIKIYIKQIGNNIDKEIFKLNNIQKWIKQKKNAFLRIKFSFFQFQDRQFQKKLKKTPYCRYLENIQYKQKLALQQNKLNIKYDHLENNNSKKLFFNIFDIMKECQLNQSQQTVQQIY